MSGTKILEIGRRVWLASIGVALLQTLATAQEPTGFRLLRFQYGLHTPMADMRDRFGNNSALGIGVEHIDLGSGLFGGLQGTFIFGNTVHEDVLAGLRVFDGNILGIDGFPADVALRERGYYTGLYVGRIFGIDQESKNLSGIRAELGLGFLQHKIRVQDNLTSVVALEPEYLPGYDRLTNGGALMVAGGYHYHHPYNNIHFHVMAEFIGARTASRRDFDYAAGGALDEVRWDLLAGLRVAWIVTISRKRAPEEIFY